MELPAVRASWASNFLIHAEKSHPGDQKLHDAHFIYILKTYREYRAPADKTGEMSLSLRGKTHRMIKEMCAGNVILFHLFHFHHVSFYIVILIYTLKILWVFFFFNSFHVKFGLSAFNNKLALLWSSELKQNNFTTMKHSQSITFKTHTWNCLC